MEFCSLTSLEVGCTRRWCTHLLINVLLNGTSDCNLLIFVTIQLLPLKLTRKKETLFIFTQWICLTRLFTSHLAVVYYWWAVLTGELPPTCSHDIMVVGLLCLRELYRDSSPVESTFTSRLMISLIWADICLCYMRCALSWLDWNYMCYIYGFCNRKWTVRVVWLRGLLSWESYYAVRFVRQSDIYNWHISQDGILISG